MCGFLGWFGCAPLASDSAAAPFLASCLRHRGPDATGMVWSERGTVMQARTWTGGPLPETMLIHNRLAIIDLSDGGYQPMSSDRRWWLAYNGEVYNHPELRAELRKEGHAFRSDSDTEVVLRALTAWGPLALQRFVGMFALALWDTQRRTLLLARDHFGIKPLYYARWRRGLAFASEIKALLALPGFERRAYPQGVYDYLRFGDTDHGVETMFAGIRQLSAGSWTRATVEDEELEPLRRFWVPGQTPQARPISFGSAADELRERFLENVRLHLRSDVPVGAALSGGIDSSAIVCGMRHVAPELPLHAFSYVAADAALSEEHWVDQVGRSTGARVHKVRADGAELARDLDQLILAQDEPFGSTSIYAQFRVFAHASAQGVPVMLDGQGADELLGGYKPYIAARAASLARQRRYGELLRFILNARHRIGTSSTRFLALSLGYLLPPRVQEALRRYTGQGAAPEWIQSHWFAERGVTPGDLRYVEGDEVLRRQLVYSASRSPLPHLLRYEDRNSMTWSVESRVPFLTAGLADFLLGLPEAYMVSPDGTTKALFRAAMRGIVPDPILNRRDKIGFATPERSWMRALSPTIDGVLTGDTLESVPVLAPAAVHREWSAIMSGRQAYDFRVWRWFNLVRWAHLFNVSFD